MAKVRRFIHRSKFLGDTNYVELWDNKYCYLVQANGERILTYAWKKRDINSLLKTRQWLEFKFVPQAKRRLIQQDKEKK